MIIDEMVKEVNTKKEKDFDIKHYEEYRHKSEDIRLTISRGKELEDTRDYFEKNKMFRLIEQMQRPLKPNYSIRTNFYVYHKDDEMDAYIQFVYKTKEYIISSGTGGLVIFVINEKGDFFNSAKPSFNFVYSGNILLSLVISQRVQDFVRKAVLPVECFFEEDGYQHLDETTISHFPNKACFYSSSKTLSNNKFKSVYFVDFRGIEDMLKENPQFAVY